MGLPADAQAVKFFAATLFNLTYRDNSVSSIGTCKKLARCGITATNHTAQPLGVRVVATPHAVFVREFTLTIIFRVFYIIPALLIQFYLDGQLSLTYRDLDLGTVFGIMTNPTHLPGFKALRRLTVKP